MTEYGTIKVPREVYEEHNEQRKALGLTWAEYMNGNMESAYGAPVEDLCEEIRELRREIESLKDEV